MRATNAYVTGEYRQHDGIRTASGVIDIATALYAKALALMVGALAFCFTWAAFFGSDEGGGVIFFVLAVVTWLVTRRLWRYGSFKWWVGQRDLTGQHYEVTPTRR